MTVDTFAKKNAAKIFSFLLIITLFTETGLSQVLTCTGANCPRPDYDNGIKVGQTKLYDENSFRSMIQDLENSLAGLRLINQNNIVNANGRIQGARLSSSSFGLNVSTMPVPGVTTTANTGDTTTNNTVNNQSATPSTVTTINTVTPNTVQTVTTNPQINPQIPTAPGQTSAFSLSQQPNVSSQDLLAEQISLEYQLMDWRLLLERSLTDRIFKNNSTNGMYYSRRDSAIVGFQINIDPTRAHKDAVVELEIVINTKQPPVTQTSSSNSGQQAQIAQVQEQVQTQAAADTSNLQPPSLVMMLPREKSYNTAVATKDAKSIGLGAVLQVISLGGNYSKNNESLYIVGDTDTVAFERRQPRTRETITAPNTAVTFGWQFRPVLGQRAVKSGQRQVYALLALPEHQGQFKYLGAVKVYTRWRKYDSKNKIVGDIIPNSESVSDLNDLDVIKSEAEIVLSPKVSDIRWEDLGNGQVMVNVTGSNYLDGLSIQAGNKMISTPVDGLTVQNDTSFVLLLPAQTIGQTNSPNLLGRYGNPTQLVITNTPEISKLPGYGLSIDSVRAKPINATTSRVEFTLKQRDPKPGAIAPSPAAAPRNVTGFFTCPERNNSCFKDNSTNLKPIVIIGGKIFGLSDNPLIPEASADTAKLKYSFNAPTQLLKDSRKIVIREPFQSEDYTAESGIEWVDAFMPSQVNVLFSNSTKSGLAISGGAFNACKNITILIGDGGVFNYYAPPSRDTETDSKKCAKLTPAGGNTIFWQSPSLITLTVDQQYLKGTKQLMVLQDDESPVPVSLAATRTFPIRSSTSRVRS